MPTENIQIVNCTLADISMHDAAFANAYRVGYLDDNLADMFTLTFLHAYNPDGSDRMLIHFAREDFLAESRKDQHDYYSWMRR